MNVCTYSCGNIPCDGSVHDENIVGKTMARSAISRLIPTNLTDSGLIIGIRDLGLENHLIPVASFNIVKFPRRILVKM